MNTYKIRRKCDGKFSTGGTSPRWTTRGKTWTCLGHLKAHLTMLRHDRDHWTNYQKDLAYKSLKGAQFAELTRDPYIRCEVVEFVLQAAGTKQILNGEVVE